MKLVYEPLLLRNVQSFMCQYIYIYIYIYVFFLMAQQPLVQKASSLSRLQDHTQLHTTLGRTPLDERSARRIETSTCQHTPLTRDRHP